MHPQRELNRIATRKAVLLGEIARQRERCGAAVVRLNRPLAWVDRVLDLGRRAVPVFRALSTERFRGTRPAGTGTWLRWLPLAFGAVKLALRVAESRHAATASRFDEMEAED